MPDKKWADMTQAERDQQVQEMLDEQYQRKLAIWNIIFEHRRKYGDAPLVIVEFEPGCAARPWHGYAIHRATDGDPKWPWRTSAFDARGFNGHWYHRSIWDAVSEEWWPGTGEDGQHREIMPPAWLDKIVLDEGFLEGCLRSNGFVGSLQLACRI